MDYTQSDSFDTHAGTGNRMHNQGKATPTAIGDKDLNQVIWSLMEVVKQAGLAGAQFDPATPGTYTKVRDAILTLMQRQTPSSSAAGGTADAITGAYTPAVAALTNGLTLFVRAASANATATPTFTPNNGTIAAKAIVKGNGLALAAGDIAGAGHWLELQYDATLDKWVLQNPAAFGRLLAVRVFTASGTYTPTPGTTSVVVEAVGGGGSGQSTTATTGSNWCGGPGGAGAYGKARFTANFAGVSMTVGAGGPASGAANSGSPGGTTSFGALLSCPGGQGGGASNIAPTAGGSSASFTVGTSSLPSGANIIGFAGASGGHALSTQVLIRGGDGGSTPLGSGGVGQMSAGAGASGQGYGSGGGGASAGSSSPVYAGGAGAPGVIIVCEYA
jgi:hypothetical protein